MEERGGSERKVRKYTEKDVKTTKQEVRDEVE